MNNTKIRCGVYIKNSINSCRQDDLELENTHVIVIDIDLKAKYRLINVYRSFSQPDVLNQSNRFLRQLGVIKRACDEDKSRKIWNKTFVSTFLKCYDCMIMFRMKLVFICLM